MLPFQGPSRKRGPSPFAPIEDVIATFGRGEIVVVVDDEDRENEGDLIMAAEHATMEQVAFMVRHTSGVLCVPMSGERLDALELPLFPWHNSPKYRFVRIEPTEITGRRFAVDPALPRRAG